MPDHYVDMLGHLELVWLLAGAQHMRALRMFHCLTLASPPPGTCPAVRPVCVVVFLCCFVCVFCLLVCFPVLQVPGMLGSRLLLRLVIAASHGVRCGCQFLTIPPQVVDLDDRQCFTARSAMR